MPPLRADSLCVHRERKAIPVKIDVPFGAGGLPLDLPGRWDVLPAPSPPALEDPRGAFSDALERPVSGPTLREAACRFRPR